MADQENGMVIGADAELEARDRQSLEDERSITAAVVEWLEKAMVSSLDSGEPIEALAEMVGGPASKVLAGIHFSMSQFPSQAVDAYIGFAVRHHVVARLRAKLEAKL